MARHTRIVIPGEVHHIVHRGNNGQTIFFNQQDYGRFLEVLRDSARQSGCAVHSYVLMQDHIHLLVTPLQNSSLSNLVQGIGRKYVRYINRTYQRSGTLWQGRFKSAIVDAKRYLLSCSQYIELNPLRTGLVKQVEMYPWSSYRANALGQLDAVIEPHTVYQRLGTDSASRAACYQQQFISPLDTEIVALIREKTQQGRVIGSNEFQWRVDSLCKGHISRHEHGGDRRSKLFNQTSQALHYTNYCQYDVRCLPD